MSKFDPFMDDIWNVPPPVIQSLEESHHWGYPDEYFQAARDDWAQERVEHSLITEREKTHGAWEDNAQVSQSLKRALSDAINGRRALSPTQREALSMICVKLARIVNGDPNFPDHWDDIARYAELGERG